MMVPGEHATCLAHDDAVTALIARYGLRRVQDAAYRQLASSVYQRALRSWLLTGQKTGSSFLARMVADLEGSEQS